MLADAKAVVAMEQSPLVQTQVQLVVQPVDDEKYTFIVFDHVSQRLTLTVHFSTSSRIESSMLPLFFNNPSEPTAFEFTFISDDDRHIQKLRFDRAQFDEFNDDCKKQNNS